MGFGGPDLPEYTPPPRYEVRETPFDRELAINQARAGGRRFDIQGDTITGYDAFGNPFTLTGNFRDEAGVYGTFAEFDRLYMEQSRAAQEEERRRAEQLQKEEAISLQRQINQLSARGQRSPTIRTPRTQSPRITVRSRGQFLGIGSPEQQMGSSTLG